MALPLAPNQTLYIKNLDDKISTRELKIQLYCLFSYIAPVVNIEARKGTKTRGQAWVSFTSEEAATNAMQRLQGFNFLGKEMVIAYSQSKSKALSDLQTIKKLDDNKIETDSESEDQCIQQTSCLRVDGYPPDRTTEKTLRIPFRRVGGLKSIELKENYALVYYETAEAASEALTSLQNWRFIDGYRLSIQYYSISE